MLSGFGGEVESGGRDCGDGGGGGVAAGATAAVVFGLCGGSSCCEEEVLLSCIRLRLEAECEEISGRFTRSFLKARFRERRSEEKMYLRR